MTESVRMLLVEDDLVDQMAFRRMVDMQGLPYHYIIAGSIAEARQIIADQPLDLVILDYVLGDGTAFDLFDAIPQIPFLIATGTGDEETAVQAIKQGAYDYLIKDPERNYLKILPLTVENAVKHHRERQALRESEMRFRIMADQAPVLMWMAGPDARCLFFNKPWLDFTGRTMEQELGKGWAEGVHAEDYERCLDTYLTAFKAREPFEMEYRLRRADGVYRWVLDRGTPRFEYDGRFAGYIGTCIDITERKQAQEDLHRAHDATLKAAQETARLKTEFLANMSHEIRTPMNGLLGVAGMLMKTDLDDQQRELTRIISTSGEVLLTLINDILDLSKIEAGKLEMETLDFDLHEPLEGTVELFAEQARVKGLELVAWIDAEVPVRLRGDPGRLRQVLTNLVGNAVKFTESGDVVVRITKASETPSEVVLHVAVRDTGIGIPDSAVPHLFEMFRQADGSTTRKYGGTGLGLAISKQLVALMNGEIGVTSTEGEGTTFWFTVPLQKQPAIEEEARTDLHGLRVLIVDDNATLCAMLAAQTAALGMTATTAQRSTDALALLRRAAASAEPFDLVLLDAHLPEADGVALPGALQEDPAVAATPLVPMPFLGEQTGLSGHPCRLAKPVRASRLFACLVAATTTNSQKPIPSAPPAPSRLKPCKRQRILIVEDNPVNQLVTKDQVEELGFETDTATNGREALEALTRAAYPLVLMDCQMPDMDGYTATEELRRREAPTQHTVVIAMTAHALQGDREKCLAAGMDDYLSKPVRTEALRDVLERWLEPPASVAAGGDGADIGRAAETIPAGENDVVVLEPMGGADMLDELIKIFLNYGTARMDDMRAAVKEKDLDALEFAAHGLKGSSATLGIHTLTRYCGRIEELCYSGTLDEAAALFDQCEAAFDHLHQALAAGHYTMQ